MPEDLDRAVDTRIAAHRPAVLPPFEAVLARKRRRDRRRLAVGGTALSAVALVAAGVVLPSLGGSDRVTVRQEVPAAALDAGSTGEHSAALARWQERGAADYTVDVELSCFCPAGTYRVTVRDGRAVDVTPVGRADRGAPSELRLGVAELFELVRESEDADGLEVAYEPELGYPTSVRIDPDARAVDDEVTYTVSAYTPAG